MNMLFVIWKLIRGLGLHSRMKGKDVIFIQAFVLVIGTDFLFSFGAAAQRGPWPPNFWGFLITHDDASQSVGLLCTSDQLVAETSTCTTHNTHNTQTSMPPEGFEPTISAGERPQTYALDRAATGTGHRVRYQTNLYSINTHMSVWIRKTN